MQAIATYTTGLDTWRRFGTWHLHATLCLHGLELADNHVTILAGRVTGRAVITGEAIDGPALVTLLTDLCQFDEVQVDVQKKGGRSRSAPARRARLVTEGRDGDRRRADDSGAGDLPDPAADADPGEPATG